MNLKNNIKCLNGLKAAVAAADQLYFKSKNNIIIHILN